MKETLEYTKPLWISFIILLVVNMSTLLIPQDSDAVWLWGGLYYWPFVVFGGIYLYGLIMGIWIQRKSGGGWKQLLALGFIMFLILLAVLSIPAWRAIRLNGLRNTFYSLFVSELIPSTGCAIAYLLGASITKCIQRWRGDKHRDDL